MCVSRGRVGIVRTVTFSLGGVKRGILVISATLLLVLGTSACSGDDAADKPKPTKTATTDPAAAAQAEVTSLVKRYWAVVVEAENTGDASPEQFDPVARGSFIELELKTIRDYNDLKLKRVGRPELTAIEVDVKGDKAAIMLCLNEDGWTAEQDGNAVEGKKFGPGPWGAEATRAGGTWLITDIREPDEGAKSCA